MSASSIRLRLDRGEALLVPGVYDALSAKLAERAGFGAVFVSGYGLSASLLGEPDLGFIGMPEVLDAAERIARAVDVPVIVDADTGYGNAFHVEKLVHGLVARGVAGCFLEDQEWPKRCGHMESKRIVEIDQYVPKLRAAVEARGDSDFFITARTDALAVVSLDEALKRAKAYSAAGADAIFVEAPRSLDDMRQIRDALSPETVLVANMVEGGKTPMLSLAELKAEGFRFVIHPVSGLYAAAKAMAQIFETLAREGTTRDQLEKTMLFSEMNQLLELDARYAREKAWSR